MRVDCTSCRFSQVDHEPDAGYEDGPLLRCHRYPPSVATLDGELAQTWPNVGPGDWCGEHEREGTRCMCTPVAGGIMPHEQCPIHGTTLR